MLKPMFSSWKRHTLSFLYSPPPPPPPYDLLPSPQPLLTLLPSHTSLLCPSSTIPPLPTIPSYPPPSYLLTLPLPPPPQPLLTLPLPSLLPSPPQPLLPLPLPPFLSPQSVIQSTTTIDRVLTFLMGRNSTSSTAPAVSVAFSARTPSR